MNKRILLFMLFGLSTMNLFAIEREMVLRLFDVASPCGRVEALERLLDSGDYANIKGVNGISLLHCAVLRHHLIPKPGGEVPSQLKKIKILLQHGADLSARNMFGRTPLHFAAGEYTKILLEAGAKVNARDDFGRTPLHTVRKHELEKAKLLIELVQR